MLGTRVVATTSGEREQLIAAEITQLWSRCGRATLRFELGTGKAIIDGLHHGSVDAWRKRRKSHPSLRKISELLSRTRSPSQLYNAACAYALTQQHPSVLTLEQLKAGHLHAVAGLPHQQALELLERAIREGRSVRQLREAAAQVRTRGRGGRPTIPDELRQIQKALRAQLPSKNAVVASLLKSIPVESRFQLALALDSLSRRSAELGAVARHALPHPYRVLVVEADETWRRAMEHWLDDVGYAVRAVASPAEALAVSASDGPFDMAVAGIGSSNPADAIEQARRFQKVSVTRVVLVTDQSVLEHAESAREVGPVIARVQLPGALYARLHAMESERLKSMQTRHPTETSDKGRGAGRKPQ